MQGICDEADKLVCYTCGTFYDDTGTETGVEVE